MKVTVVMPVRNDAWSVEATMEALFAQTRLPDEIVVADGCSTDDTVARIEAFANRGVPLRVVRNESRFAGGGRNVATRAASHDLIVGLDFGNRPDRAWLESMVRPFEQDPALEYLSGIFYPILDTWFERTAGAIIYFDDCLGMTWTKEELAAKGRVGLPGGMCVAYRRSLWERTGGFPEWARKGQDRLLSLRVRQVGGKTAITLDAVMHHHMAHSTRAAFEKHFHYGLWAARTALPTRRFRRLALVYTGGSSLAAASFVEPRLAWVLAACLVAYFYVGAWRKLDILTRATRKPFSVKQRCWAIVLLCVKDAAILSGTILGSLDRLLRPRWRRMTREYLEYGR